MTGQYPAAAVYALPPTRNDAAARLRARLARARRGRRRARADRVRAAGAAAADRRRGRVHRPPPPRRRAAPIRARPGARALGGRRTRCAARSPPRTRPGTTGRAWPGRIAPRSSCAPPSSPAARGGRRLNAVAMLDLSKTVHEADIDAACETADYLAFHARYMREMYEMQPDSLLPGVWNRVEYRPLEGFVIAISPFNFLCLATLAYAPAIMGNVVLWKPAEQAELSAWYVLKLLEEAGLPPGVINLVFGDGRRDRPGGAHPPRPRRRATSPARARRSRTSGARRREHRPLPQLPPHRRRDRRQGLHRRPRERRPRRAGDVDRARRVRVPGPEVLGRRRGCTCPRACGRRCATASQADVPQLRVGDPTDPRVFVGAVIDDDAFAKQRTAPSTSRGRAPTRGRRRRRRSTTRRAGSCTPTVVATRDPGFRLLLDELFGPIMTTFVYPDSAGPSCSSRSTGRARTASPAPSSPTTATPSSRPHAALRHAAGNVYVNDKPTGSVVGAAAVRRLARLGDERQGHVALEPQPLGDHAHDEGDVRAAARLALPVDDRSRRRAIATAAASFGEALVPRVSRSRRGCPTSGSRRSQTRSRPATCRCARSRARTSASDRPPASAPPAGGRSCSSSARGSATR